MTDLDFAAMLETDQTPEPADFVAPAPVITPAMRRMQNMAAWSSPLGQHTPEALGVMQRVYLRAGRDDLAATISAEFDRRYDSLQERRKHAERQLRSAEQSAEEHSGRFFGNTTGAIAIVRDAQRRLADIDAQLQQLAPTPRQTTIGAMPKVNTLLPSGLETIVSTNNVVAQGITDDTLSIADGVAIALEKIAGEQNFDRQWVTDKTNAARQAIAEQYPTDPRLADGFWTAKLPRGVASAISFMVTAEVGGRVLSAPAKGAGGAAVAAGRKLPGVIGQDIGIAGIATLRDPVRTARLLSGGAAGGLVNGTSAYREALALGADEDTAFNLFLINGAGGVTEAVPIIHAIDRAGAAKPFARRLIHNFITSGVEEVGQETLTEFIRKASFLDYGIGEPGYFAFPDPETAAVSFITGGFFAGVADVAGVIRDVAETHAQAAELVQVADALEEAAAKMVAEQVEVAAPAAARQTQQADDAATLPADEPVAADPTTQTTGPADEPQVNVDADVRAEVGNLDDAQVAEALEEVQAILEADKIAPAEQRLDAEERANVEFVRSELVRASKRTPRVDDRQEFIEQSRQERIEGAEHPTLRGIPISPSADKAITGLSEVLDQLGVKVGEGEILFPNADARDTLVTRLRELAASRKAEIALTFPQRKAVERLADKLAAVPADQLTVEQRVEQAQTVPGKGPDVRAVIRRLFMPGEGRNVTERQALRASLSRQRMAATLAYRAGRRDAEQKAKAQLRALREKLTADAKAKADTVDGLQGELVRIVKTHLPADLQGRLLTAVKNAKTHGRLANGIAATRKVLAEHERRESVNALVELIGGIEPSKMLPNYRVQVEKLLDGYQTKGLSKPKQASLAATRAFLLANPDHLMPRHVLDDLKRLDQKPISQLTADEADAVAEALTIIVRKQQIEQGLIDRAEQARMMKMVAGAARELAASLKAKRETGGGRVEDSQRASAATMLFGGLNGWMTLETILDGLGGGESSVLYDTFYRRINAAHSEFLRGRQAASDFLNETLTDAGLELGGRDLAKMSRAFAGVRGRVLSLIPGSGIDVPQSKATFHSYTLESGATIQMTSAERMGLVAMLRDMDTREAIALDGVPIALPDAATGDTHVLTLADIDAIESSLTPAELHVVDELVAYTNGPLKKMIRNWSVKHLGHDITAQEVYFPRHRRGTPDEPTPDVNVNNLHQMAADRAGLTRERTGGKQAIKVEDIFTGFLNHAHTTAGAAMLGPVLRDAQAVLNHDSVSATLDNTIKGDRVRQRLQQVLDALAADVVGGPDNAGPLEQAARPIATNLAAGLLGANIRVAAYQHLSIMLAANEMPMRHLLMAEAKGAALDLRIDQRIAAASPWLRERLESSGIGLLMEGQQSGVTAAGFSRPGDWKWWLIHQADNTVVRVVYRAAEAQAEAEGLNGQAAQKRAAQIAERVVRRTQSTFDPLHSSGNAIEARTSMFARTLTFFDSQRFKHRDIVMRAFIEAKRDPRRAPAAAMKAANVVVLQSLSLAVVQMLSAWALSAFDEQDEERIKADLVGRTIDNALGNAVGGQYVAGIFRTILLPDRPNFDPSVNPMVSVPLDLYRSVARLSNAAQGGRANAVDASFDLMEAIMALNGIPVAPVRDTRKLVESLMEEPERKFRPALR